jgi:nucleotide-binding universal stress UspA family protein
VYKKILVPLEEGRRSRASLDQARELAVQLGAALVLLQVITVLPAGHEFDRRLQIEEGSRAARVKAAAEAELGQLEGDLRAQGVEAGTAIVISEEPVAQAIVTYAEANQCDLIVMPNQERSAIGRWLFGSVSEKVRRRSSVPVLFVPETQ